MSEKSSTVVFHIRGANFATISGSGVHATSTVLQPGEVAFSPFVGIYRKSPTEVEVRHRGLSQEASDIISKFVAGRDETTFFTKTTSNDTAAGGKQVVTRGSLETDDLPGAIQQLTSRLKSNGFAVGYSPKTREFLNDSALALV